MSIVLSVGGWGGVYLHRGYAFRVCLGWVALTFIPEDIDDLLNRLRGR